VRRERSLMLDTATRLLFPTLLLASLFLLVVGHDQPGGGFSGGLVAGAALVLRFLAGGDAETRTALRLRPGLLLAAGVLAASGTGAVPLLLGEPLLTAGKTSLRLPVIGAWIGEVALSTTLLFEAGVYAVVLGLVQTLLRTLGSDSEEHQ